MYKLDPKHKWIIIKAGTITEAEEKEINDYVKFGGYTPQVVKVKKSKADHTKEKDILAVIGEDEKAVAEYKKIKEASNFFKARKWFKDNYVNKKGKKEEKK